MLRQCAQIMLVVGEYGTMEGIITMEDLFEILFELEILDEKDNTDDMRQLARKTGSKRQNRSPIIIISYT